MKQLLILIFTFFLSITSSFAEPKILQSEIGQVEQIEYLESNINIAGETAQNVKVRLLSGNLKGADIQVENILTGNPHYDIKLRKGKKVILHVEDLGDSLSYSIQDIQRSNTLVWLSLIFCGLLIYIGKKKGLYSLVAIALTCILIFNILTPMLLMGINAIVGTMIICLIATALTMYLVGGLNRKSTSATLGCTLSIIFAGLLSFFTTKFASLTGFSNENTLYLYSSHPELNFINISISTMILAALGAVMDVAMSIASTINEIYEVDNTKSIKELFSCGMNVGRDIIGTMANTLILVYLGSSLPLLMLSSNIDLIKFINLNQVVTEIASALIGSSAIVICVPITAIVAANLITSKKPSLDFSNLDN